MKPSIFQQCSKTLGRLLRTGRRRQVDDWPTTIGDPDQRMVDELTRCGTPFLDH